MKKLELTQIQDPLLLENFKTLQAFMDSASLTSERFRVVEVFFTDNASQVTLRHGLNFIPLDVIVSRLIAPSGAKLTFHHSEFTSESIVVTVSGLTGVLNARLLIGSFPNVISINGQARADNETQEVKSKV